jgi:competence protein ComEA
MLERFRYLLFGAVLLAIAFGIVALLTYRPPPITITILPPMATATAMPTATPAPIRVYVTGAVNVPGQVFTLPYNSRVADAVAAANGFTTEADTASVNLAEALYDGRHVHVKSQAETAAGVSATPPALAPASADSPVRINTGDEAEISRLPGVGPELAKRIIEYRTANGPFASVEALDAVPGIGPARLAEWKPLIRLD